MIVKLHNDLFDKIQGNIAGDWEKSESLMTKKWVATEEARITEDNAKALKVIEPEPEPKPKQKP